MQTFTNLVHRKACGYVGDRLRRPAPLSPLPEQARKAGKCSPSPTYPQAPQQTREIDINGNIRRGSAGGPKRSTSNHLTPKAPYEPAPAKAGGISTGGFEEALAALLGKDAGGLSASTIARLRDAWAGRAGPLAESGSAGQALRLLWGRRHFRPSPRRSRPAMPGPP